MDLFDAINSRRSVRSFSSDAVPQELIQKAVDAAHMAPSANNRQPWEFIAITDRQLIEQLAGIWSNAARRSFARMTSEQTNRHFSQQPSDFSGAHWAAASVTGDAYRFAYGAPVVIVVFISQPENVENQRSAFLAVQNLLLALHAQGLAAVPTTRAVSTQEDADAIRQLLRVPEGFLPVAVIPLGYPAKRPGAIRRRPLEEVLHWNYFGQRSEHTTGEPSSRG